MTRAFTIPSAALAAALLSTSLVGAQVAGTTLLGVAEAELRDVATGWSAKHQVLGQPAYNDKGERIGTIDDVIISPEKSISYAIVGTGGFLGVGKHDVAVPVARFKQQDGKLVLAGATKEALKATPAFEYTRR